MSRSWTPMEQAAMDEYIYRQRGERLSDQKWSICVDDDGPYQPLWNDEARAEFPCLSFLLNNFETGIYEDLKNEPSGKEAFAAVERDLAKLRKITVEHYNGGRELYNMIEKAEADETVKLWYLGKLDPGFYYGEENNALLIEYVNEKGGQANDEN